MTSVESIALLAGRAVCLCMGGMLVGDEVSAAR